MARKMYDGGSEMYNGTKIGELLERQAENSKVAIKCDGIEITYSEWYKKSMLIKKIICNQKDKVNQNIAIFLPNSIEYAITYFGILFAERTIIPIFVQAIGEEIKNTLEYCKVNFLFTFSKYRHLLIECLQRLSFDIYVFFVDTNELLSLKKGRKIENDNSNKDVAIMLHTSGTTSNPKRVMLTHDNLLNNVVSNILSLKLQETDKGLIWIPMMFGYCNTALFLTHVYLGASLLIQEGTFTSKRFFEIVQNEKITNFTCVPSILLMILEYRYRERYDITSLRYICFGGGKMPEDKLSVLLQHYSEVGFVQTYGQTEASPRVTALLPEDAMRKLGSVGKAIPNVKVKVVDEFGKEVSKNQIGEIIVSGKNVMKGYYLHDEITQETIRNGWLYTGDLGYFDEEEYLYLVGRIKNIIISGGINIYPEEIEEILMENESVKEAYVFGVEDELLGEVVEAKVILNTQERKISERELKRFCMGRIARYKVPRKITIVEIIEKTYNGKIKRELMKRG